MQNKSGRWVGFPIIAVVLVFCVFIIVIWRIGLFDFSGPDASAKIFPASLALVGGLFGSLISIIGLILKFSLDQRNTDIKAQAESRLELEAAIQAVGLLSTSEGNPVPTIQRAGVLYTLTNLKFYDLALSLTSNLIAKDEIDASIAATTLDYAMKSGVQDTQEGAVMVFHDNIEKFLTSDGSSEVPDSLYLWQENLSIHSRYWGVFALAKMITSRCFSKWEISHLDVAVSAISLAWINEEDQLLKQDFGTILKNILIAFPSVRKLFHPKQTIDIDNIRSQVDSVKPYTDGVKDLIKEIKVWATEALNSGS